MTRDASAGKIDSFAVDKPVKNVSDIVELPSGDDRQWLADKENYALVKMRNYLGDNLRFHRTEADLQQVQLMIDDGVYDSGKQDDLHAFGVVLGNVFDTQNNIKLAVVTN